jgi:hypothetical protein
MKRDRTYEFKFSESITPSQHLAFLCQMLEAAELSDKKTEVIESAEIKEIDAA